MSVETAQAIPTVVRDRAADVPVVRDRTGDVPEVPGSVRIRYDAGTGRIWIRSEGARLDLLVQELAKRIPVPIASKSSLPKDEVSVRIEGVPLEQALQHLFRDFNTSFVYESPATRSLSQSRLAKVSILSRKAPPASPDPAVAAKPVREPVSDDSRPVSGRREVVTVAALAEGSPETIRQLIAQLQEPAREEERRGIVAELLRTLDEPTRPVPSGVLVALRDLAPEQAVAALIERLQSSDERLRAFAAGTLGRLGDERAVETLASTLSASRGVTRDRAATSLALIGGPKAMDSLLHLYATGEPAVRYPIWLAIASHGDASSQRLLATQIEAGRVPGRPPIDPSRPTNPNVR